MTNSKMEKEIPEFDFSLFSKEPQRVAIIGPSGSGKTTLCYRILEDAFMERTDIFVVYAQNKNTLSDWKVFFEFHDLDEKLILVSQTKDDKELRSVAEGIGESQAKLRKKGKPRLMYTLILDDFIGSLRGTSLQKKQNLMHAFLYQSRHDNMNVFFLLQNIKALEPGSFSSNTANILMKDESRYTLENHYYPKILGHVALANSYEVSKGKHMAMFARILRELKPFESLITFKNLKTQRTKLYLIANVEE